MKAKELQVGKIYITPRGFEYFVSFIEELNDSEIKIYSWLSGVNSIDVVNKDQELHLFLCDN